jgi:hypothetical protein
VERKEAVNEAFTVKRSLASRLAKDIISCDASIVGLVVLDPEGQVLTTLASRIHETPGYIGDEMMDVFGSLVVILLGAAQRATPILGGNEYIIGAFKNYNALIVALPVYGMSMAMLLLRSSSPDFVYRRVRDMLASGGTDPQEGTG